MELQHDFEVAVPPAQAWDTLTDLERIAPCLPGAHLDEVEGDEYRGTVKVKVGPITAQYRGTARFAERDQAGGRAVLLASGRDTKGQGNASATITATLAETPRGTRVDLVTDLTISGKVAQFGRGVMADVSSKLMDQFVERLEQTVLVPAAGSPDGSPTEWPTGPTASEGPTGLRRINGPEPEPIDLLATAGGTRAARRVPVVLGAVIVVVVIYLVRRRRRAGRRRHR